MELIQVSVGTLWWNYAFIITDSFKFVFRQSSCSELCICSWWCQLSSWRTQSMSITSRKLWRMKREMTSTSDSSVKMASLSPRPHFSNTTTSSNCSVILDIMDLLLDVNTRFIFQMSVKILSLILLTWSQMDAATFIRARYWNTIFNALILSLLVFSLKIQTQFPI